MQITAENQETETQFKHPDKELGFWVGVSADKNSKCRRTMEDAHYYCYNYMNVKGQGFFGIYDGHAGKVTAEFCGTDLHLELEKFLKKDHNNVIETFQKTFAKMDELIAEKKTQAGCTVVTALTRIENNKRFLYTANVGDARAVLCRNKKAIRLTYDHKGSDQNESKRITEIGGFMMNDRVNGILAVTRSLGDKTMKEFVVGEPFTSQTEITKDDQFLILACDGIWDVCSDQDAVNLIVDIEDPQAASKKLLDYALNNFSTDNLSVLIVRFIH